MAKVKSHVAVMAKKYELNKRDILVATFTSETAYHTLQFNTAIAWIRLHIWNDEDVVSAVLNQPDFWTVWVNQWNLRENAFLFEYFDYMIADGFEEFLKTEWLKVHEVNRINFKLSGEWMKGMYDNVINKVIKGSSR